ncbi:helix-turn-helix domain-containing protein [Flavobacterium silvaticum]|uniref:Helix-turn-helix transcriptional regulator n=1 Tax=Flavobacterium silvaticum TaxID=1852020 RepID=A0A972G016_9FLAO|nr:helix-turn-helix domain-containing protein [Flavobacterium silvaticum]NMH27936.1 helix-turn-helix transcriptional regulator [Flavobacterium silvaticum]
MDFNLLISTLIGGGLALLSFLHLSNAIAVNRKANFVFGIFSLLWASFWLDEMVDENFLESHFGLWFTLKMAQFFVGLVFYTSVRYYTNPDFKFSRKDLRMLIAPLIFIGLLLNRYTSSELTYNILYLVMFLGHSLAYTLLSYATVIKHQKNIETFSSNTESIDLKWIKYITYSFIVTLLVVIVYNIFRLRQPLNVYINFHLLVVVYLVAFYSVRQKEIFPRGFVFETDEPLLPDTGEIPAKSKKLIDDTNLDDIKSRLISTIEKHELYLDSELNLLKLADKMQLSTHQLSFVINNGIGENFFNFINGYRVKRAEELLTDPKFDYLTIVAIGFESGFNSKTSFNTTFKKITSFTPTEFRRMRSTLSELNLTN